MGSLKNASLVATLLTLCACGGGSSGPSAPSIPNLLAAPAGASTPTPVQTNRPEPNPTGIASATPAPSASPSPGAPGTPGPSPIPSMTPSQAPTPASGAVVDLTFSLPQFESASAFSWRVYRNGVAATPQASSCAGLSCSATLAAPAGAQTFGIVVTDGSGFVLDDGTAAQTIVPGTNVVTVSLDPVAASARHLLNVNGAQATGDVTLSEGTFYGGYVTLFNHQTSLITSDPTANVPFVLSGTVDFIDTNDDRTVAPVLTVTSLYGPGVSNLSGPGSSSLWFYSTTLSGDVGVSIKCNRPGQTHLATVQNGAGSVTGFSYSPTNYPVQGSALDSFQVTCL